VRPGGRQGEAATHHELLDAWEAAKAKRDGLAAELKEIEDARIEALANGGKPPPHPDRDKLALERAEIALGAEIKLLRWCDRLLGALKDMAEGWDEVLEGREEGARQARADALRTVERADLDLAELAGQRAYVAAVLGGDSQAHYGEAIQPADPLPPQPMTMPRTGMEGQIVTVT
jgi:hypothetical protein